MEISVIVICRNEESYIEDCLRALADAAGKAAASMEIIVVDGCSTDQTVATCEAWAALHPRGPELRVIHSAPGYSRQRNCGVRAVSYTWIAFVSADVRVPEHWLEQLPGSVETGPDLLIGAISLITPPGARPWMKALAPTIYPTRTAAPWTERASTAHLMVRRSAALATPFDEGLNACEDKDFAFRLQAAPGWRGCGYLSAAGHLARETLPAFLVKIHREGRALGGLSSRYGRSFPDCFGWGARAARSAALLGLVCLAGLIAIVVGWTWLVIIPLAALWLIVGNWHRAGWRKRKPGIIPLPVLAVLHVLAMLSITSGCCVGWAHARAGGSRQGQPGYPDLAEASPARPGAGASTAAVPAGQPPAMESSR